MPLNKSAVTKGQDYKLVNEKAADNCIKNLKKTDPRGNGGR